ncbi:MULTISPECIES: flavodoxin [Priestia]|uniref:flavodoxin n=1 Tax=Priestia TaxID=2800373 RepID=UPI00064C7F2C|nr:MULTISPECIES: flavodoxin [Priestia]MDN4634271.1 flavodoxin [Sphingomonas sp. PsM26]KLV28762.1 flavodoxin [Priestia megaterium]KWU68659.1 flavodoxin [Priestia megaterium]MED3821707.1 flavodoxin [Priestia aryabhattai]MED4262455.1 flavodoxin [Priestia aryabhattai]
MAKILIAYASMSGNTEEIAELIKSNFEPFDYDIDIEKIEHLDIQKLVEYDGILLGVYTWGNGDLPYEVEDFYDEIENVDLTGKKAAIFGSGDRSYPEFCAAVDLLEEKLELSGVEIVQKGLKIELAPETEEDIEQCNSFAISFSKSLEESSL